MGSAGASVLVVDDDDAIREIVVDALQEGSFEAKAATSSEEAIVLLRSEQFRVLVLDVGFGSDHVKGWAVARRARAADPSLPIIYITGGSKNDWSVEGVPKSLLLTKPFAPVQLVTAIAQLLNEDTNT